MRPAHTFASPPCRHRETGMALVEFAAIGFVLAILFTGVLDLGLSFYNKNTLIKGVQEASRYYAMNCIADIALKGNSNASYNAAMNILYSNITNLKVTSDNTPVTLAYIKARTSVGGITNANVISGAMTVTCPLSVSQEACASTCDYIEFKLPSPAGSPFVLGKLTITNTNPIRSVNRIMR
jgi:Flp pilus assembly protein TadG